MERALLNDAIELLQRLNARLEPGALTRPQAGELLTRIARAEKLLAYARTVVAGRVRDAVAIAAATGTSVGRARRSIETAEALHGPLAEAFRSAEVSADQAHEIAKTETVTPGAADTLLEAARTKTFRELQSTARRIRLDAQTGDDLGERQHRARRLDHRITDLGMVRIEAELEPHVGAPLVARLDDIAERRARQVTSKSRQPIERHRADALAAVLAGGGPSRRSELVVLVSHEVATRGWTDVHPGETCKIPGVGPIDPDVARRIGADAFLSGVVFDGTDLRHTRRWTRSIPPEVRLALHLGPPPDFDGMHCVDCGSRTLLELDHREPFATGGASSTDNLEPRCEPCHDAKTRADHESGRLKSRRAPPAA